MGCRMGKRRKKMMTSMITNLRRMQNQKNPCKRRRLKQLNPPRKERSN